MYFFLMSIFFLFSNEEKVMLCVVFLFFFFFLFCNGGVETQELMIDSLSFSMVFLSLILMMIVFMSVEGAKDKHFFLCMSMVVVILFFLVENFFFFFIFFEFSLVPVFMIISFWGVQPERILAIKYMMMYTLVASSPLLYFILSVTEDGSSMISLCLDKEVEESMVFFSLLAFWVKIPLFFFHSWLPKAHVEAPLEGSMILAGVMLKVGMYGMIRILSIFSFMNLKEVSFFFFSLGLFGSLISVVMAISSDDMKMSVAFSSISHMNFCVASLASVKIGSIDGWVMVMISHGLCSPMMFYLVTKIYKCSGSRSMLISKGLSSKFPFFQFLCFLVWSMNISIPPSMSFMGEVMMIISLYSFYCYSIVVVFFFFVFSSFFSMMNYGIQGHSSISLVWKSSFSVAAFCNSVVFSGLIVFFFFFFFDFFCM